jgi:hypothetical protein
MAGLPPTTLTQTMRVIQHTLAQFEQFNYLFLKVDIQTRYNLEIENIIIRMGTFNEIKIKNYYKRKIIKEFKIPRNRSIWQIDNGKTKTIITNL